MHSLVNIANNIGLKRKKTLLLRVTHTISVFEFPIVKVLELNTAYFVLARLLCIYPIFLLTGISDK